MSYCHIQDLVGFDIGQLASRWDCQQASGSAWLHSAKRLHQWLHYEATPRQLHCCMILLSSALSSSSPQSSSLSYMRSSGWLSVLIGWQRQRRILEEGSWRSVRSSSSSACNSYSNTLQCSGVLRFQGVRKMVLPKQAFPRPLLYLPNATLPSQLTKFPTQWENFPTQ